MFSTVDLGDDPRSGFGWVLVGFAAIHWLVGLFNLPRTQQATAAGPAWRRAAVFAVAAGTIQLLMMRWGTPHGYWLVLLLASVLRPVGGETRSVTNSRIVSTVAGVVIAIGIVWLAPQPIAVLLAIPCAALMIGWAVMQDLGKQAMFGTSAIILIGSAGVADLDADLAVARLLLTALCVIIAARDGRGARTG